MPAIEGFNNRLVLGTAQWGMDYGIANEQGIPAPVILERMLAVARIHGVKTIDTARAYGQSEERIGKLLDAAQDWRVITKLDVNLEKGGESPGDVAERFAQSLRASMRSLRTGQLYGVMLHRISHRVLGQGAGWDYLLEQQALGRITKVGVSVLSAEEAMQALEDPAVQIIQVASNLFDQRLARAGFFGAAKQRGVEVYLRSIFLQGLPFISAEKFPDQLTPLIEPICEVAAWAKEKSLSLSSVLLRYAACHNVQLVVGCENDEQLIELIAAANEGAFGIEEMRQLESLVPALADTVLDPWRWPVAGG